MIQLTVTIEAGKPLHVACPGVADPLRVLGILALAEKAVLESMEAPRQPEQKVVAAPADALRILRPNGN